jgi:hypothetical protein
MSRSGPGTKVVSVQSRTCCELALHVQTFQRTQLSVTDEGVTRIFCSIRLHYCVTCKTTDVVLASSEFSIKTYRFHKI